MKERTSVLLSDPCFDFSTYNFVEQATRDTGTNFGKYYMKFLSSL
jgi:hypothetical protein